jgi:hypothetical protein
LCCDNKDADSENYIKNGYFIKPIDYWKELLPNAILVDYHTEIVYNKDSLKIPLSWNIISE